jgi:hypothetical protein
MAFFSKSEKKDEPKKEEPPRAPDATPRTGRVEAKPEKKTLRSFVLGLATSEKLAGVANEKLEEGLKAVLPKNTKVTRIEPPESLVGIAKSMRETMRFFEVALSAQEMPLALAALSEKGLLDGQVEVSLEQCVLVARASGKVAAVTIAAEPLDSVGLRFEIRGGSTEVQVQYPPVEVHKRWLADDDYRAAYTRWRAQRSEDGGKGPKWQSGWPAANGEEAPPWIRLRAKDGKTDEFALEFDEKILLRFAFQGAEITIMRFNLKVLANKLTNEFGVYRSLPLSLGSVPKEVQDRMNREPERFKPLKDSGRFGPSFDLVRAAYESLGDDYFFFQAGEARSPAASAASGSSQRIPAAAPGDAPIPLATSTPATGVPAAVADPLAKVDPFGSSADLKNAAAAAVAAAAAGGEPETGRPKHAQGVKSIASLAPPSTAKPGQTLRGAKAPEIPGKQAEPPKAP